MGIYVNLARTATPARGSRSSRMGWVCVLAFGCFVGWGCPAKESIKEEAQTPQQASAHPVFLWKVTHDQNPKSELILYGSLSALYRGREGLDTAIQEAYQRSQVFAVETDYGAPRQKRWVRIYTQRFGVLAPGTKLFQRLSRKTLRRYLQACKVLGISPYMLVRMRPWLAGASLLGLHYQLSRYQSNQDKEQGFVQRARASGKKIYPLLVLKHEFKAMGDLSFQEQDALVLEASNFVLQWTKAGLRSKVHAAYRRGDLNALDRHYFTGLDRYPTQISALRKILSERSIRIVQGIKGAMGAVDKRIFLTLGVGLLAGQMGVLRLLQSEGFKVERLPGTGRLYVPAKGKAIKKTPLAAKSLFAISAKWFRFRDSDYGFAAQMPTRPIFENSVVPSGFGEMAMRVYVSADLAIEYAVAGFRYPVQVSMSLRQPRQRARIFRKVISDYLQKHGGKLLRQLDRLRFAGRPASYIEIQEAGKLSKGYIIYYQGQVFFVYATWTGRVTPQDYRRKATQAFFRSFRLLPAISR